MSLRLVIKKLCLLVVSIAITLLLAELIVRVFFPQAVVVPWQDQVNRITAPRPGVHGRHAVPRTFDVTLSFNSQRFRGTRDYQQIPPPESLRIATLGDSFTLGYGANDDDTYPSTLERRLKAAHVEVINAANAGTGTGEQALWYETWVKAFHPRVVILAVTANDVDDDAARTLFSLDGDGRAVPRPRPNMRVATPRRMINAVPGYAYLAQHSQLWGLFRNAISAALAPDDTRMSSREVFEDHGLQLMKAEIRWLDDQVRHESGRLVVVFIPSRESIYSSSEPWAEDMKWKSKVIVAALTECCARKEITFMDLGPQLKTVSSEALYYEGLDFHPTPNGYRNIAEIIARLLVDTKIVNLPA